MNYHVLGKSLGSILLILGFAMLGCFLLGVAEVWYFKVEGARTDGLFAGAVLAIGFGSLMRYFGAKGSARIMKREAVAIVGLGWTFAAGFGAIPFYLSQNSIGIAGAFFESTSGFTTTGSTVFTEIASLPKGLLLWRSLTQWLGGAGILVLFVALLNQSGVGSKSLFRQESSAPDADSLQARAHDVAVTLWRIYLGLTVLCFLGLWVLSGDHFIALTHALTTVSTGGFSPYNDSVAGFNDPLVEWWIILFMFLGGISFMLMAFVAGGKWQRLYRDNEFFAYGLIIFSSVMIITAVLMTNTDIALPFMEVLRHAAFQVVSIMTTTGYVTQDYDQWPVPTHVVLIILMMVGGCAGSTSGGIKVGRIVLLFKIARQEIIRTFRPNQIFPLRLNGKPVSDFLITQSMLFLGLNGLIIAVATVIVSLLEPHLSSADALSAVIATLFNIGPGLGVVGAVQNFAHLGNTTQLILSFLMLLGRLELFAILTLFVPSLWRRKG